MLEEKEKIKLAEFAPIEAAPAIPEISPEAGMEAALPTEAPETGLRENAEISLPSEDSLPAALAPQLSPIEIRYKQIESILEEDLADVFARLDPKTQLEFKMEGGKTIEGINSLLSQAKIKAKKIIDLIRHWLHIIPGINKHFLEQEAKIKADKILGLADRENQKIV